jgi:hypothetical protein
MKIDFRSPATEIAPTLEIREIERCLEGAWEAAVAAFQASNLSRLAREQKPSSGMQSYLTDAIDEGFLSSGWVGGDGRYSKGATWVRVSFRHAMSLGSDFMDAQRQINLEKYEQVALLYAHQALLKRISPKDGGSLCSFERAALLIHDLETISPGIPVWLGRLDL